MCAGKEPFIIDDYKIIRQISNNGHSIIYEAVSTKPGAGDLHYIIKEYLQEDSSDEIDREIQITHLMENQSDYSVVIPVLKRLGDSEYTVMLCRHNGMFLADILDDYRNNLGGYISVDEAISLTEAIISSLEKLHGFYNEDGISGVLHLDLHPGNIFYESYGKAGDGNTGTVKFLDFSNAHICMGSDEKYSVDVTGGSIPHPAGFSLFSAPELMERNFSAVSFATDLYSVSAVFFYILSGKIYHDRINLKDMIEQVGDKQSLPSVARYSLRRFFQCGLSYNPVYRFSSAKEMMKELHSLARLYRDCRACTYTNVASTAFKTLIPLTEVCRIPLPYDMRSFEKSVSDLNRQLHQNIVDSEKCKYMFNVFLDLADHLDSREAPPGKMMLKLLWSGIMCCNNTGDHLRGDVLRKRIEQYKEYMSVPEYLNLQLHLAEQENDRFEYFAAYERTKKTVECLEIIKETFLKCAGIMQQGNASAQTKELGRAYSALGRYLSFLSAECKGDEKKKKADEAEKMFRKALVEFSGDKGNREITICHILHFAVCNDDIELYSEFEAEYFGMPISEDIPTMLQRLIMTKPVDVYKLFIFLKCLHHFHRECINENVMRILSSLMKDNGIFGTRRSPIVPLVYRHIGQIMYAKNGMTEETANTFIESITYLQDLSFEKTSPLTITTVMAYQTWGIYNELAGLEEESTELFKMLIAQSRYSGWDELTDLLEKGRGIKSLLRCEYA